MNDENLQDVLNNLPPEVQAAIKSLAESKQEAEKRAKAAEAKLTKLAPPTFKMAHRLQEGDKGQYVSLSLTGGAFAGFGNSKAAPFWMEMLRPEVLDTIALALAGIADDPKRSLSAGNQKPIESLPDWVMERALEAEERNGTDCYDQANGACAVEVIEVPLLSETERQIMEETRKAAEDRRAQNAQTPQSAQNPQNDDDEAGGDGPSASQGVSRKSDQRTGTDG